MKSVVEKYKGVVIRESLVDPSVLDMVAVLSIRTEANQDNPAGTWHCYTVQVSLEEIEKLQSSLKRKGGWYMHFWKNRDMIVVFRDKLFRIDYEDKSTWKDAVEYGRSVGIPDEQLDFLIE